MFERFTERARHVMVLAQDEARALKHDAIGAEHILLGLLREEEGLAGRILASLAVRVEEVRAQVVGLVGQGDEVATGQIPFTPQAKRVLELALREALSLGHNYIGTEHILLGLVRENEGVAVRILLDLGIDADKMRNEMIRMLSGPGSSRGARPGAGGEGRMRFTSGGKKALALAREEAQALEHDSIATEHILLGLLREGEGLAARLLGALGITAEDVRSRVAEIDGAGAGAPTGRTPFTPRARQVIGIARHEALSLGRSSVGTEHLLFGLVSVDEGGAARILRDFRR